MSYVSQETRVGGGTLGFAGGGCSGEEERLLYQRFRGRLEVPFFEKIISTVYIRRR